MIVQSFIFPKLVARNAYIFIYKIKVFISYLIPIGNKSEVKRSKWNKIIPLRCENNKRQGEDEKKSSIRTDS